MTTQGKRTVVQAAAVLILLSLGFLGMKGLMAGKTKIKRQKPPAPIPAVRVMTVQSKSTAVLVKGEGTVRPIREVNLVPQVSGKVIEVSPALVSGGRFREGDVLFRIDPVDFQLAVTLAEAKVKDAQSRLQVAREEAAAAREEWNTLHPPGSPGRADPPPLVLKVPQLKAAEARLAAEKAARRKAYLNLERTVLRAPFNGIVSREKVDVGQYVVAGQPLGSLFSTDAVEVVVPFDERDLSWFRVPGFTFSGPAGSRARVKARLAGRTEVWEGRVVRTECKIDAQTRMVDVVIHVDHPYRRQPPLAVGLFVDVEIRGRVVPDAVFIPLSALHEGDRVWVVEDDNTLHFRKVVPGRINGDTLLVTGGLKNGDRVVTSRHPAVTDGMKVRVIESEKEASS